MLDDLKEEEIVNKVGGRFKLSVLIQKRTESRRQMCIHEKFHASARCVLFVASIRRENS